MPAPSVIARSSLRLPLADHPAQPKADLPICKICDLADWDSPSFAAWAANITGWPLGADFRHRKIWELVQTARALKAQGLLDERAAGLSVAAGNETLLFYLANHIGRMVATDIYGQSAFASREADKLFLVDQRKFAPYDYRTERLKALYMNALDLSFADNTFDFAYSLSSIEHFGGVEAAIQALREMVRVVKSGGLVIVATECCLNGVEIKEVFSVRDIERLAADCGAELIEPIDYRLSDITLQTVFDHGHDDLNARPHVNLVASGSIHTSILLAFRKPVASKMASDGQSDLILQNDWNSLDEDLADIQRLFPGQPAVLQDRPLSESPYARLPLIGTIWNWSRRPLHDLVRFYVNQQAELQASEINRLANQVLDLRRQLRRLAKQ